MRKLACLFLGHDRLVYRSKIAKNESGFYQVVGRTGPDPKVIAECRRCGHQLRRP